ncbi:MAG: hypothetical protein H6686_02185 [Fibrobacteria bacterium]|nr:hypothetical protein [Fibrobacteria bacterium]
MSQILLHGGDSSRPLSLSWCGLLLMAIGSHAALPTIGSFTPDSALLAHSIYATDSIRLPSNSGLANGGVVAAGKHLRFGDGMRLRSPFIGSGRNFDLGSNTVGTIQYVSVDGDFTFGSSVRFDSSIQVLGNLNTIGNDVEFRQNVWVRGNFSATGNQNSALDTLQVGGNWNAPNLSLPDPAAVYLAATSGGPSGIGSRLHLGSPFPTPATMTRPLVTDSTKLPGYAAIKAAPSLPMGPAITISGTANPTDDTITHRGRGGGIYKTQVWTCDLGPAYCKGDTLLPGSYGPLIISGAKRALLLTEGVYSFDSLHLDAGSAIVSTQPTGGRTVLITRKGMSASSSNSFIGPDSARMATGFGGAAGQFLGGSMMVVSGGDMTIPSDLAVWATLSAPVGTVRLSSQVLLFGQIFARNVIGDNMTDFGEGAYIPFRGEVPVLTMPSVVISEGHTMTCKLSPKNTAGRSCNDTTVTVSISWVTPYTVTAHYELIAVSPVSATPDVDFLVDTGTIVIPIDSLSAPLKIHIYEDRRYEGPETFLVRFTNIHAAAFPDSNGRPDTSLHVYDVVTGIHDDDVIPKMQIKADSAVHEGDSGTRKATLTFRLLAPGRGENPLPVEDAPELPISFRWRTWIGIYSMPGFPHSADTADHDYINADEVVHLPRDSVRMTLSFDVVGDKRWEFDEFLGIRIHEAVNVDTGNSFTWDSVWILNDDPMPEIRLADTTILEPARGDTAVSMVALRASAPFGLDLAMLGNCADSTATSNLDPLSGFPDFGGTPSASFTPCPFQVRLKADSLLTFLPVNIFGDGLYEGTEHFRQFLTEVASTIPDHRNNPFSGFRFPLADSLAIVRILDADTPPILTLDTAWVVEPESGTRGMAFRVHLDRPSSLPSSFTWSTTPGTAQPVLDYIGVQDSMVALRPGLTDTTIVVTVVSDSIAGEGVETLTVSATPVSGLDPDPSSAEGHVIDAQGLPRASISDVGPVTEADSTIDFPVALDWYPADTVELSWRTLPGSAPEGVRWVPDSGRLILHPGQRFASIPVRLKNDLKRQDQPEDFFVLLEAVRLVRFGDSVGRAVLLDDGDEPLVTILPADSTTEGDTAWFTAKLFHPTRNPVTVHWSFQAGTAEAEDVLAWSGSALILPGDTLVRIPVPTRIDTLWEPTEFFHVRMDSATNAEIGSTDSLAVAYLLEEGDLPRLSFESLDTTVVEDSAGTLVVRISLSRASSIPLQTAFQVGATSSALRILDWSIPDPLDDTLRFPAGSRATMLLVAVVPDTIEEPQEQLTLELAPQWPLALGTRPTWTLQIIDDDHWPVVVITRPSDSLRTNERIHTIEYTVDGVPKIPSDTSLVEGWNHIERTYTDNRGHTGKDSIVVWGDFTPPEVQVFKITGPNPLHPERDTTWWGDRARTRFGQDTIWYWVRDSALLVDGITWHVSVDTLFTVTDFSGDGLFPTRVESCDEVGNCGADTGWIDLKQSIPVVRIIDPVTGQVVQIGEVPVTTTISDGGKVWTDSSSEIVKAPGAVTVERCFTDDVGNTGCDTTHPVADPIHVTRGTYVDRDGDGRIDAAILTLDVPWSVDSLPSFTLTLGDSLRTGLSPDRTDLFLGDSFHLIVPITPAFSWGRTFVDDGQTGWIHQTYTAHDGVHVTILDSFPLADSVPPVILAAEVHRVESYTEPDTLWITPSEPLTLHPGSQWVEVGTCTTVRKGDCDPATVTWHRVPAESLAVAPDGRLWLLVPPGEEGSVRPGYVVRFLDGVADTLGNRADPRTSTWSTLVVGPPRPELVQVTPPSRIPVLTTEEQTRSAPGGILIRASRGSGVDGQWWEPGEGYLDDNDPRVRQACPDVEFCNGPTLYINRPVRMIVYIYDNGGTFAFSRTIDITQEDIDSMEGDKIDRLHISLEWNHRTGSGEVVGSGVYVWRIVSQLHDEGETTGLQNLLWKTGVRVPRQ